MVVLAEIRHLLPSAPSVLKVSLRSKWPPFLVILLPNTTFESSSENIIASPCTRLEVPRVENFELILPFGLTISPLRGLRQVKLFDSIIVIAQSHLYIVCLDFCSYSCPQIECRTMSQSHLYLPTHNTDCPSQ